MLACLVANLKITQTPMQIQYHKTTNDSGIQIKYNGSGDEEEEISKEDEAAMKWIQAMKVTNWLHILYKVWYIES